MMHDTTVERSVNSSDRTAAGGRTLAGRIHMELRRRIARGQIEPGARLVVDRLADEFSTSITPIREALRLLERDGLIEFRPHCGATVTSATARGFAELSQVRSALEPLAAELACGRLSDADLAELDATIAVGASCIADNGAGEDEVGRRWSEADDVFHALLWRRSGNALLEQTLGQLVDRIRLHREMYFVSRARIEQSVAEHRRVVEALRAGDAEAASARMSDHMKSFVALGASH